MSRRSNRGTGRNANKDNPQTEAASASSADEQESGDAPVTSPETSATDVDTDARNESKTPRHVVNGQRFLAPLEHVAPNPVNIREEWEWEEDSFKDLTENIDELGVQQDPTVISYAVFAEKYKEEAKTLPENTYWVLGAGERRYRAALANGATELPMVLRDDQIEKMDELIWSENQNRAGLHPLQEGRLLQRFKDRGLTAEQIQAKLGRRNKGLSEAAISKKIRLYNEVPDGKVRTAIGRRVLGVDPAYLLLTKYGAEGMEVAYQRMRDLELIAKDLVELDFPKPAPKEPAPEPETGAEPETDTSDAHAPQRPGRPEAADQPNPDQGSDREKQSTGRIPAQPVDNPSKRTGLDKAPATKDGKHAEELREEADDLARFKAGAALLASERDPDEIVESVFIALINNAPEAVQLRAQDLLDASGIPPADGVQELARRAEAIAAADAQIRLARRSGGYDVNHLRGLVRHGYEPTPTESDLLTTATPVEQA
ncbi:ParB/RepB/Spo0J family partition protein [Kitasatospora sp. NPDC059146]|uniref:ParB/RepB/Spo0J family partition protein n=1 Tax=unclassified Kitasatospora TaxID=2633591 RepID=UPI00367FFCA0